MRFMKLVGIQRFGLCFSKFTGNRGFILFPYHYFSIRR